jgi:hypothetical protein
VIVNQIHNEVWEPGVLSLTLEKSTEKLKALLPEMVAKKLKRHKSLVAGKGLSEQSKAEIIDLVIGHIDMN